jgi:hypothetical protein
MSIKFKPDHAGIGELLRSQGVQDDLKARAERVAAAARAETDMPILVDNMTGKRARYRIVAHHPKALRVEAKHRLLGRAIDAAGG